MKLLKDIPIESYNDVDYVLDYIKSHPIVENEDVKPIEVFHCFWKGTITDLHLMCLTSLYDFHPHCTVIFWCVNPMEIQSSYSWVKIKRLFKDKIVLQQVSSTDFRDAGMDLFFPKYTVLTSNLGNPAFNPDNPQYNTGVAYASDIVRFAALYIYGGVWFDLDVLFLRNLDSIKLKRFVSQWGTDRCGNGALLKLEKGHDLVKALSKIPIPFYPKSSFQLENDIDLTILPATFFDILWQDNLENLQFQKHIDFFSLEEFDLPKEIYTYHWHNGWNNQVPPFFRKRIA